MVAQSQALKWSPPSTETARWRPLYEELRTLEYNTLVSYGRISEILGRDSRVERGDIYRAQKELERHDHRTLICETNQGYRIANPSEHRIQADKHRKKSFRQLGRAKRRLTSAAREKLTEDECKQIDEMEMRLSQYEHAIKYTSRQMKSLERGHQVSGDALTKVQDALDELRKKGLLS